MQIRVNNNVLLHSKTIQKLKFSVLYFRGSSDSFFPVYMWIILFKINKSQCNNAFHIHISYIYFLQKNVIRKNEIQ